MNRRVFLRGLGGAVVAAPYLSSVWERRAKAQSVGRPKQLIAMFTHYGCDTNKWFPSKAHGALVAADLVNTLTPLQPYVGKVLIPRGLRAMNEWTQYNDGKNANARGQGNDPHLQVVGSYFTCQPVTPNSNNPFSFDSATKFNAKPVGTSLDHVMAQQLSPSGTPLFIRVGNTGGTSGESAQSNISYLKDGSLAADAPATPYPGYGTPSAVFAALTGLLGPGAPTPDSYAAMRGKKVTDLVKGCLADFERQDMSGEDRNKVAAWKAMLNDVGAAITGSQCTTDVATRLGATAANVAAASTTGTGIDLVSSRLAGDLDGADINSALAVLATACAYNPVIFLKYPPNYTFKGLGINVESSNISHRLDNAGMTGICVPNALAMIQTIDKFYASKFAKLVGMLDGIKNGDGSTLLDSSAAVWFNEMSDGNAHNLNNLPVIQAGSCGGYFKTGWTINVDTTNTGSATLSQGNSESQCADGTGMTDGISQGTGTDPKVANAPINKYFCNLMNAMGVKADANGYPKKGGVAEVTRFGYSDLTTDFVGGFGAVAGAGIHSPGAFTALKA
jgi:hypothetical protein